jgi:hypothetical protein
VNVDTDFIVEFLDELPDASELALSGPNAHLYTKIVLVLRTLVADGNIEEYGCGELISSALEATEAKDMDRDRVKVYYPKELLKELKMASIKMWPSALPSKDKQLVAMWIPSWVEDAVQKFEENDGFAGMKLYNFLRKMNPDIAAPDAPSERQPKDKTKYKKNYPTPRTKAAMRRLRRAPGSTQQLEWRAKNREERRDVRPK